ncbi:unnamed protein product [Discula destructiva]
MATPTTPNDPTAPISPARFAAALKDLSLASLHLKVLELRNALLHLGHSNAQLRPFADGTATALDPRATPGQPDPDCVEAIAENEGVMARMRERIDIVKAEVLARGASWREFEDATGTDATVDDDEPGLVVAAREEASRPLTNGLHGAGDEEEEEQSDTNTNTTATRNTTTTATTTSRSTSSAATGTGNPWTDGTFQMGTIRNGELHMDTAPPQRPNGTGPPAHTSTTNSNATTASSSSSSQASSTGGRLTDDELRRLLEVRLAEDAGDDDDDGGLHL